MKQTFGQWLKEKREETGLSQERLAEAVGMDRAYINKVERGRVNLPNPDTRERFHHAFGTSESDLVEAGVISGPRQTYTDQALREDRPGYDEDAPLTPEEEAVLADVMFTGLRTLTPRKLRELIRVIQAEE